MNPSNFTTSTRAAAAAAKARQNAEDARQRDKAALNKVIAAIQALREVSPNMTLNQALVFLEVAKGCQSAEGRIENLEVRKRTGLESGSLTKIIQALSPESTVRGISKLPVNGFDLIDLSESETDGRAKQLYLTDKGQQLAERIIFSIS